MLPVDIVGMESFLLITSACVPFPAPGAPKRMIFMPVPSFILEIPCSDASASGIPELSLSPAQHRQR
jgi:hypothetical protein